MRTTTLGPGGPSIGVIGLGCMGMSYAYDMAAPRDEHESVKVIRDAVERGCTLIDTADAYGPFTNEELIGRALTGPLRDRAVLATKVGLRIDTGETTNTGAALDGRPEHVRRSIDQSLRRLGTDHVELYQLHRVDPDVPLEETWGAMAELVAAGKALHLGLSEVGVEEIVRAEAVHPVAAVQSELSLWTRGPLADVLPYCAERGISFLPCSPLGRGFLTGRFSSFDEIPPADRRRELSRFQDTRLRANLAIVEQVRAVASGKHVTVGQVALAWLLAQGEQVVPIPGTKTHRFLVENLGAADVELDASDLAALDALPAALGERV